MEYKAITYAQNREDLILSGFFTDIDKGFYVDVGANDPNLDSVTKHFYNQGWHGINIEPIKRHHNDLKKQRPRDINLNMGISNKKGTLTLREYEGSGLSTFSQDMQKQYLHDPKNVHVKDYTDYKVPVETLRTVFKEHAVPDIHFMKVDVEGYEYEVLESNDWSKYRPWVICIEANHVNEDWHPLLEKQGYKAAFHDGLNEYLVDTKRKPVPTLDYVQTIIYREPIVNARLIPAIEKLERTAAKKTK